MLERATGKLVMGCHAPTLSSLYFWIKRHPTFEVVQSVPSAGLSMYQSVGCVGRYYVMFVVAKQNVVWLQITLIFKTKCKDNDRYVMWLEQQKSKSVVSKVWEVLRYPTSMCLSVCLSVYQQNISKSCWRMWIKLCRRINLQPRTSQLDFGIHPDLCLDPESICPLFRHWEMGHFRHSIGISKSCGWRIMKCDRPRCKEQSIRLWDWSSSGSGSRINFFHFSNIVR